MNQNPDIKGKKLLLMGGLQTAAGLIDICHRNGASLGVTDYNKGTYLKQIADEAFDVDAFDINAVIALCKEHHYDGVITQFVDRVLPLAADVAEGIGAYSPFTKEQIRMSADKAFFKKTCMEYGVPVPKLYEIEADADLEGDTSIEYPVLVKPVDNSSSRGLVICRNAKELQEGLKEGRAASHSGRALVEAYLPYDEINVTYIAQDGDIQLAAIHDRYFNETQKGVMKVPDLYIYPSRYTNLYYETVNDKVIRMLKGIGVKNGSLFMQAVVHNGQVYFYEAGMRLNGCKTYEILEVENNYNTLEHLSYYCLTGNMGRHQDFDARFKKWYATWNVIGLPGRLCHKFLNLDALNSYPWVIKIGKSYAEGTRVREHTEGTLLQLVGRIHIEADTKAQLFERLAKLEELFQVVDDKGDSVILPGHDLEDLKKRINYEL
ncbi:MAG: ATP-grasp domain-containing protein [Oscillospiraceae bacterium]|nr:ATP-grasp domain-containing protein [Oscillospiraceae bacterium]